MLKYPQLVSHETLLELSTTAGPNGKYLAKDGLNWVALNKNDERPFIESINAFVTFEMALRWLEQQK